MLSTIKSVLKIMLSSLTNLFSGPPPKPGATMSNAYVETDLERVIDAHPECADVIREAMRLLNPPDDFKVLLAENIAKAWPRRRTLSGTQRTQAQTIRVMRQPCFQPEIKTFKEQVLPALDHAKNSDMDPRDRSVIYNVNAGLTAATIIEGIDVMFNNETHSVNGILTGAKSSRAILKYAPPPCSLMMSTDDYNALPAPEKETVKEVYKKYNIPIPGSYVGGRKTKKRKSKKRKTKKRV
jgi:hypothetical protein